MPDDRLDRLRLIRTEGVGPVTYRRLLERYRTPPPRWTRCPARPRRRPPQRRRSSTRGGGGAGMERTRGGSAARLVFLGEADYPPLLALTDDAPPCLIVLAMPRWRSAALCRGSSAAATPRPTASAWRKRWPRNWPQRLVGGLRPGARHRHRRASRRHAHRPDHRRDRRRDRPALSAGKRRLAARGSPIPALW